MKITRPILLWSAALGCAGLSALGGCTKDDAVLAPYAAGGRALSTIVVEDSVYLPRITWLGGYVTVLGVNRGTQARLDTSLVWLIVQPGDNLHYPVQFNTLPAGAQDMTANFGGRPALRLVEDNTYTFWVLKGSAWAAVSANAGKVLVADSATGQDVRVGADSIVISNRSLMTRTALTDLFINIRDVNAFGKLVTDLNTFQTYLNVEASDTSNRPLVTWTIVQAGVTDQNIAALGVNEGSDYSAFSGVWEMISKVVQPDTTIYWKNNVIPQPLRMGSHVALTESFKEYPAGGLRRGSTYYLWIASKDWDGKSRSRVANNYGYVTFTVW